MDTITNQGRTSMPRREKIRTTVSLNGEPEIDVTETLHNVSRNKDLENYVDRLERLHVEKREVSDQIKDVLNDAEGAGFSKKALAVLVKRRLETPEQAADRRTIEDEIERMEAALGAFGTTPLGESALHRAAGQA